MADRQPSLKSSSSIRVVAHRPWRRVVLGLSVVAITAAGALIGYRAGLSVAAIDSVYLDSLERRNAADQRAMADLRARLVEAELAREVDRDASRTLRDSIRELRDQVASLGEEVTFYKSLMAPSSLERGLQIAELELRALEGESRYAFHLLLTQVETRRDWVQGETTLEVHGRMRDAAADDAAERVLPLKEIAAEGSHPLKFRFRYFQELTGEITLPAGFEPDRVVVSAVRPGAGSEDLSRTFEWLVAS
jgi:hypothetical protein